jgi:hypothetical protein
VLNSLLGSIQTPLFSKGYLLGGLFPTILFATSNGGMLWLHDERFKEWVRDVDGLDDKTLAYGALVAALLVTAHLLSTLQSVMLEAFEGKHRPVRWLAPLMYRATRRRVVRLGTHYHELSASLAVLESASAGWVASLGAAKNAGDQTDGADGWPVDFQEGAAAQGEVGKAYRAVRTVLGQRSRGSIVPFETLEAAVKALEPVLRERSSVLGTPSSTALGAAYDDLNEAIRYVRDRLALERRQTHQLRQFNYPGTMAPGDEERSTHNLLAPTQVGNIGRTMRSYALTRYGFDLDIFWTRLQKCISSDYFTVLQDAKVQLESLVALTWLSGVFTAVWCALLVVVYPSRDQFLIVGIAGPVVTRALYLLVCHSYLVLADVIRSAVDLFRFDLLKELHQPLPYGIDEERRVWLRLGQMIGYGEYGEEKWAPIYVHPST